MGETNTTPVETNHAANDNRRVQLIDAVIGSLDSGEIDYARGLLSALRMKAIADEAPTVWDDISARIELQRIEVLGAYSTVVVARDSLDPDTHGCLCDVLDGVCERLDRAASRMDSITSHAKEAAGKSKTAVDSEPAPVATKAAAEAEVSKKDAASELSDRLAQLEYTLQGVVQLLKKSDCECDPDVMSAYATVKLVGEELGRMYEPVLELGAPEVSHG